MEDKSEFKDTFVLILFLVARLITEILIQTKKKTKLSKFKGIKENSKG